MIGQTISHYKIIEELGRGGMGVVYKAEDTRLKRVVALKFLSAELTRDTNAKTRFTHEAQAASALQHHNICTIHEIDQTLDGRLFICMDYYPGETLKTRLDNGPLSLSNAIDITAQTAEGLAKAHEAGMVHRDVKPANIAVTTDGVAKILDFGIAMLSDRTRVTRTGASIGTVEYMSPEQARGEDVTPGSDVWSLGVVLYEMLAGRAPFSAGHEPAILYSIVHEFHQPVTELRDDVPANLARIVDKALAKNPSERYRDAGEMARELRAAEADLEIRKRKPTPDGRGRSGSAKRRAKLWVPVGFIALLVLALLVIRPLFFADDLVSAPRPIAVISFENHTGDPEYDYLRDVIPNLLITSLEQSKYLSVVTWERMRDLVRQAGRTDVEIIDKEIGFEVCRLDGIDTIVFGTFTKAGDVFVTDVKVLDVNSKELVKSATAKGEGVRSILDNQIDDLGRKISRGIGLSERSIEQSGSRPIAAVTTRSMEAYDDFLRGRDACEKMYYEDARRFLENAVEIDSTFAAAWSYLGFAHHRLRNTTTSVDAYERAMALSSQASEKDRLWIKAVYAYTVKNDEEGFRRWLSELVAKYPREKRAWVQLGISYRGERLFDDAKKAFEKALDLDPTSGGALNGAAYMYTEMTEYDKAIEYFERYAAAHPGDANPYDSMGEMYFRMGELDMAVASYQKALAIKPDFGSERGLAYVYAFQEDYARAIETSNAFIAAAPSLGVKAAGQFHLSIYLMFNCHWHSAGTMIDASRETWDNTGYLWGQTATAWLEAWLRYLEGDFKRSRECLVKVGALQREARRSGPWGDFMWRIAMGRCELGEDKIAAAKARLADIDSLLAQIPDSDPEYAQMAQYNAALYRAEILLAENKIDDVISVARSVPPVDVPNMSAQALLFYIYPADRDVLARAFARKGDLNNAIAEYIGLITVDPGGDDLRLIYAPLHYRLARLYEKNKQPGEAVREYKKFLGIVGDVDPTFAELEDARARLKSLSDNMLQ